MSDVLGSILLVAITVLMAGAFALLLFSFKGPEPSPIAAVAVTLNPGAGGWGTGDESLRLTHNGGEALQASDVTIAYSVNGVATTLTGASQLGGAFSDGELTVGETWSRTTLLAATDVVAMNVVNKGAETTLMAKATLVPGQLPSGATCVFDTAAPTVSSFAQSPADVQSTMVTAVTVTATLTDDCSGVDPNAVPELWWRANPGTAFAKVATPMAKTVSSPCCTWQGAIPTQTWATYSTQALEYELRQMKDLKANTGTSTRPSDPIDLFSYPNTGTAYVGSLANFAKMQSGTDSGATGTITDVATQTATIVGTAASGTGTTVNNAKVCDASRTTLTAGQYVDVTTYTAPGGSTGIRTVTLILVAERSVAGAPDPTVTLSYKIGATPGATSQAYTITTSVADTTFPALDVTADRAWTVADLASLHTVVTGTTIGTATALVNCIQVAVTYQPGVASNYASRLGLDWTGIPNGNLGIHTLQMSYMTSVDTYQVWVYDWTAAKFTNRGGLSAGSLSPFSYLLTATEFQAGGNVKVRLVDATPAGGTPGVLTLDYARVATT
ncbi:MAG: type IV pilin N-terminal domain-containing protein [Thermoplasmatota archaeon]